MGVVVCLPLYFEGLALLFEIDGKVDIQSVIIRPQCGVVFIFNIPACVLAVLFHIYPLSNEFGVKVLYSIELSRRVYHRLIEACSIHHYQRRYTISLGHLIVIRTKSRGNMHDTGSIFSGYKVSDNHLVSTLRAFYPGEQLLITDTHQFFSLNRLAKYTERDFFIEVSIQECFCHNIDGGLFCIGIYTFNL